MRLCFCTIVIPALAVLAGCSKTSPPPPPRAPRDSGLPPATRGLELQDEDYVTARRGFKTKLVRKGPAPQVAPEVRTPPGAAVISYDSGSLRLQAYLGRPAGGEKRPAVLFLHGGFAFGEEDWEMARPFLNAGFVVMIPVLRGENGQPGDFTLFYDEVDDVLAAADVLTKQPFVDSTHLYVAGHSAGATLTLQGAMASDRFRAAAAFSACVDQTIQQDYLLVFDRTDIREFRLRSPVAYATSFKCATRIYYGDQESWAKPGSWRTALLAKRKGLDVEAIEVPGDHNSSVPEAMRQAIAFFREK